MTDPHHPDLANERLGGAVVWANDEFFASKDNLVKPSRPVWKEDAYTDRGKWMDGWETRRRREPGHDLCVVRLGLPGVLHRVDVDTTHFDGNQPESCRIEGAHFEREPDPGAVAADDSRWTTILDGAQLDGDSHNVFEIGADASFTHVRFHIVPDGGVARLRIFGEAMPDLDRLARVGEYDVAGVQNGGRVVDVTDEHFGRASNLLLPTRPANMGEGWETKRRRGEGFDSVTVRLGSESEIRRAVVDTEHFKGNYPAACRLEGCRAPASDSAPGAEADWRRLLAKRDLRAHTEHVFEDELIEDGPFTHVRLHIHPDGGVARLRLYGAFTDAGWRRRRLRELDASPADRAREKLLSCCGAEAWAESMLESRPFESAGELLEAAESTWESLDREDWLEAFAAHPRIGASADDGEQTEEGESWSEEEQSGTEDADEDVERRLRELNERYYDAFGFIFIVFASGKSAQEMLEILERRIANDRETEIENAAAAQLEITKSRLQKLLAP